MTIADLKKYKDSLYTSLSRDLSEFEKNFLLISSGLLAFSITFIKEIVKINEATYLCFLFIGWGFITLSIGLMMITFLKSSASSDELWTIVDNFIIEKNLYNDTDELDNSDATQIKTNVNNAFYKSKDCLKTIRYLSVMAFILGLISLGLYSGINLTNESHKENTTIQKPIKTIKSITITIDSTLSIKTN